MSDCHDFPVIYTDLQLTLLALLPEDGSHVSVAALGAAAAVSSDAVADAFFDLYLAHVVDYHVRGDMFSLPRPAVPVPAHLQGAA